MYHRILFILFSSLFIATCLSSQERFFPNMANSITPSEKNEFLIGAAITTTNFGQAIDAAIGYSPANNFGIMLYQKGEKGSIAIGGGLGWYKTIKYTERKTTSRKFDFYTCLFLDKLRHQSFDIKYANYSIQGGMTEQYKKWGFNLNTRLNIVDYNTIEIRKIDESLTIAMKEVDNDPAIYPDVNIKLFYGNEIKGFINFNRPFYKESVLINTKTSFSLGAEVNLGYVYQESLKYFKRNKP